MFVLMIFSESQNILLPNLDEPEYHAQNFVVVAIFRVMVTVRAHMIQMRLSTVFSELLIPGNQTWSDDTSSEARVSCEKNWITAFRVKVTVKGQNVNVCPDDIF